MQLIDVIRRGAARRCWSGASNAAWTASRDGERDEPHCGDAVCSYSSTGSTGSSPPERGEQLVDLLERRRPSGSGCSILPKHDGGPPSRSTLTGIVPPWPVLSMRISIKLEAGRRGTNGGAEASGGPCRREARRTGREESALKDVARQLSGGYTRTSSRERFRLLREAAASFLFRKSRGRSVKTASWLPVENALIGEHVRRRPHHRR